MFLNHLNLPVPDVEEAVSFFERFFGFRVTVRKGEQAIAVLENDNQFVLVLMKTAAQAEPGFPKAFHIGFLLSAETAVDAFFAFLEKEGLALPHAPRKVHGSYGFYFHGPGNLLLEVATR